MRKEQKPLFPRRAQAPKPAKQIIVSQPQPISRSVNAPGENGEIMRWLAPAAGRVRNLQAKIGRFEAKQATLLAELLLPGGKVVSQKFKISGGSWSTNDTFDLGAGDLIRISLEDTQPDGAAVGQIDVAFLFEQGRAGKYKVGEQTVEETAITNTSTSTKEDDAGISLPTE